MEHGTDFSKRQCLFCRSANVLSHVFLLLDKFLLKDHYFDKVKFHYHSMIHLFVFVKMFRKIEKDLELIFAILTLGFEEGAAHSF